MKIERTDAEIKRLDTFARNVIIELAAIFTLSTTCALVAARMLQRGANEIYATERMVWLTAGVSALGVVLLLVIFVIARSYRRRIFDTYAKTVGELVDAALVDHLTRLGNRRAYSHDLRHCIAEATREDHDLALALVDVDDLKVLNDRLGHLYGDEVLTALGALLHDLGPGTKAYRIGGDEFAVIFANAPRAVARETLEHARCKAPSVLRGTTISIGIATLLESLPDSDTLHARADAALYAAKNAGRDVVAVYDDADKRLSLVSAARVAGWNELIAQKGVGVAFQPIWDVDRRAIVAFVALARPASDYGFSDSRQVFDFATRVGRAHELDRLFLNVVLERARAMPADALLFLRISPQSLRHTTFDAETFTAAVRAAGLRPERFVIEVAERALMLAAGAADATERLHRAGVRIALAGAGAGNAGLALLGTLPLDFVKIHHSVIANAGTDRGARAIVAAILSIAETTGAYVIAEGIDTLEALEYSCSADLNLGRKGGIRGLQGYVLGGPTETFYDGYERDAVVNSLEVATGRTPGTLAPSHGVTP